MLSMLLLLVSGCSLIVGSKLEEGETPGDAQVDRSPAQDGGTTDQQKPQLLRGEHEGNDPFTIAEQLRISLDEAQRQAVDRVEINGVRCPGMVLEETYRCTIPPQTEEGIQQIVVKSGTDEVLAQHEIQVQRKIAQGAFGARSINVLAIRVDGENKVLAHLEELQLPGPLLSKNLKLSPSGRYLLFSYKDDEQLAARLGLLDLVNHALQPIANVELENNPEVTPEGSFEPEWNPDENPMDLRPERKLWVVATGRVLKDVLLPELPNTIATTPPALQSDEREDGVFQIMWIRQGPRKLLVGTRLLQPKLFTFNPENMQVKLTDVADPQALGLLSRARRGDSEEETPMLLFNKGAGANAERWLETYSIQDDGALKKESAAPFINGEFLLILPIPIPGTNLLGFLGSGVFTAPVFGEVDANNQIHLTLYQEMQMGGTGLFVGPTTWGKRRLVTATVTNLTDRTYTFSIFESGTNKYLTPSTYSDVISYQHHPRNDLFFVLYTNRIEMVKYSMAADKTTSLDTVEIKSNGKIEEGFLFVQP